MQFLIHWFDWYHLSLRNFEKLYHDKQNLIKVAWINSCLLSNWLKFYLGCDERWGWKNVDSTLSVKPLTIDKFSRQCFVVAPNDEWRGQSRILLEQLQNPFLCSCLTYSERLFKRTTPSVVVVVVSVVLFYSCFVRSVNTRVNRHFQLTSHPELFRNNALHCSPPIMEQL